MSEDRINYVTLLVVIILGVTIGNLTSNFITATYAEFQLAKAAKQLNQELQSINEQQTQKRIQQSARNQRLREERKAKQQQKDNDIKRKRMSNQLGQRLKRACEDWTNAATEFKGGTAEREMKKHCDTYYTYINTGRHIKPKPN